MDGALFVILIIVVAGGAWLAWWLHQRKLEHYTAHAKQLGFTYTPYDRSFLHHWRGMPLDKNGKISDIFSGVMRGVPVHVFEYSYQERIDDKNTRTVELVMTAAQLPVALPETRILHETAGAKITKFFGAQDIQFESSAFNDAFLVKGADERATHALIDPRMMEFMLHSPVRDFQIRLVDSWVLMWQPEAAFRFDRMKLPECVEPLSILIARFVEHIPKHLLRPRG